MFFYWSSYRFRFQFGWLVFTLINSLDQFSNQIEVIFFWSVELHPLPTFAHSLIIYRRLCFDLSLNFKYCTNFLFCLTMFNHSTLSRLIPFRFIFKTNWTSYLIRIQTEPDWGLPARFPTSAPMRTLLLGFSFYL